MQQDAEAENNRRKKNRTDGKDVEGSVFLWLVHVETGRYLDDQGHYSGADTHYEFSGADEAARRKDELLEEYPFARVHVGQPDDPEVAKFNSPKIGTFTKEKRRWKAWNSTGFIKRMLRPAPRLTVFDPAKDPSVNV